MRVCPLLQKDYGQGILDGMKLSRPLEVSTCAACGLGTHAQTDLTRAFAAFGMHA